MTSDSDHVRVAHVCKVFSKTSETFLYDYITGTGSRDGVESHVATYALENQAARPFDRVVHAQPSALSAPRRALLRARDRAGRAWHGESRARFEAMRAALARIAPDVIHAHFGPTGVLVADAARALDAALVVSYHGYDVSSYLAQPIWRARYRRLWEQAAAVTVVSNLQRRALSAAGCPPEKIHVVRVGKRVDELTYAAPTRPVRRFIAVGRFAEKKAHLDTIRAFAMVAREGLDATLEIVGAGPQLDQARALVGTRDLGEVVELLGERPFSEVVSRMRAADAFILSSKTARDGDQEGVPTVLMEAQALGLPCISTTHAGIPEVIPEETHWALATPGDVPGIAARIRRLCEADVADLAVMTARGRAKVEREFNLDLEVDALVRLYRAVR